MNRPIRLALSAAVALSVLVLGLTFASAQDKNSRPGLGTQVQPELRGSNCDPQNCEHENCEHQNCEHENCGGQSCGHENCEHLNCDPGNCDPNNCDPSNCHSGNCDPENCEHENCDHENCEHHMCGGHHGGGHGEGGCGEPGARGGGGGWLSSIAGARYKVINTDTGVIIAITSDDPTIAAAIQTRFAKFPYQIGEQRTSEVCREALQQGRCTVDTRPDSATR